MAKLSVFEPSSIEQSHRRRHPTFLAIFRILRSNGDYFHSGKVRRFSEKPHLQNADPKNKPEVLDQEKHLPSFS